MEDILYEYEDILLDELNDIIDVKKNGSHLSEQDICNGEKILKSMDFIEKIAMYKSVGPEYYENRYGDDGYGSYNNGSYSANSGYNRSSNRANYGNNNSRSNSYGRRYGHDENEFRTEVERRMNMARNENERAVYANWLNEMDNRR